MSRIDEEVLRETERVQTQEYVLWRERFRRLRRFVEQTRTIHAANILVYVNPTQVMELPNTTHFYSLPGVRTVAVEEVEANLAEVVFHSIVADLNDTQFRSLVTKDYPYSPGGFAVFKDQGEINWLGMLSRSSNYDEDRMIHLATFVAENTIAKPPGVGFDSIVSPVLGMAVLISHVLSFCIRNSVYPLTDSQFHQRLLTRKFERLADDPAMKRLQGDQRKEIAALGLEVLDLELPNLQAATFDEVLHIREKHRDQLSQFRLALAGFADFSSTQFWSSEFSRECSEIVALKVNPAIRDLRNTLDLSRDKVVVDAFKKIRTAQVAIPLVSTLLAGMPLVYALAISAGLISVESFLELYLERKRIRAGNSLNFLLDLKGKLG